MPVRRGDTPEEAVTPLDGLAAELVRTRNDASTLLALAIDHLTPEARMNWIQLLEKIFTFAESEAGQKIISAIAAIAESHPNLLGDLAEHALDTAKAAPPLQG